jgi:hypothetical protein
VDYARLRATAQRLLGSATGFGGALTFTRTVPGAYDPATSTQALTSTAYTTTGVMEAQRDQPGTDLEKVHTGSVLIPYTASMPSPQPDDDVSFGGLAWKVTSCDPVDPGGSTVILYRVGVKR